MLNQTSASSAGRTAATLLASGAIALAAATTAGAAAIPEPDTILYGRVINRSAGGGGLITAGTLSWTLQSPAGETRSYTTSLDSLQEGAFSYRLRVPHSLVATGLSNPEQSVPLTAPDIRWSFGSIAVDGVTATVSAEFLQGLDAGQLHRGQAVRIDLEIHQPMPDTDGDGMPDWWELAHGLNPNLAADAAADSDGDGLSNLAEWRAGLSPNEDNRIPSILRHELTVYPTGTSGLALRVSDANSAPEAVAIVVTAIPADGKVVLRNGNGGRVLQRGDVFTAADANRGLLEFRRDSDDPPAAPHVVLGVALVDDTNGPAAPLQPGWTFDPSQFEENSPLHAVLQEVRLRFANPPDDAARSATALAGDIATSIPDVTGASELRARADWFARSGAGVIWDLLDHPNAETVRALSSSFTEEDYRKQRQAQYGPERPLFVLGGYGNDTIEGGYGPDVLYGGTGEDTVRGNQGADLFLAAASGFMTIADFNPAEGDRLDISRLFHGKSGYADEYIRISTSGNGGSVLEVFGSPALTGAPESAVRLSSFALTIESFADLASRGTILTGPLSVRPVLSVHADGDASENDLKPGRILVRRNGSAAEPLTLHLTFSGTATPGEDYDLPPATLTLAAGQTEAVLTIHPRADQESETDEVVLVTLSADPSYRVGTQSSAGIVIADLLPVFLVEAVRTEAWFDPWTPATIRIVRSGLTARTTVLNLDWSGGGALQRVEPLPAAIEFAKGESSRLIEVRPLRTGTVPAEPSVITLRLRNDPSYLTSDPGWARIVLVPRPMDFAEWAASAFPGAEDLRALALADPDGTGLSLLERFAFALHASLPDSGSPALPRIVRRDGRYGVEFTVRPGAPGLTFQVKSSADLRQWTPDPAMLVPALPAGDSSFPPGWHRYEWRDQSAMPRYFRVEFNYQP